MPGSIKLNVPWALDGWGKLDAVNREFVQNLLSGITTYIGDVAPPNPEEGAMWWRTIDHDLYIYFDDGTTQQWVAAVATPDTSPILPLPPPTLPRSNGGQPTYRLPIVFPPTPQVGEIFNVSGAGVYQWDGDVWIRVPPYIHTTGDTMTGPLILKGRPFAQDEAVDKQWVEEAVAAGHIFRGTWIVATNTPDLEPSSLNPLNGYNWICVTQDINIPELVTGNIPGLIGLWINNGDYVYWNEMNGEYQRVVGGSLTKQQADVFYVNRTGDTMNGTLNISTPVTGAVNALVTTGPVVINNQTGQTALSIVNSTPGLGALDIFDNSTSHSVMITNNGGGLALLVNDNAALGGDAVHFNNNGTGDTLKVTKTESIGGSAALVVDAGNRNATGAAGNAQIAFTCPGGGRPQWIATWTDVGGGAGANAEAIGFYTNDWAGGSWPNNARFAGSFNNGRFTLGYGSAAAPTLTWGNGPQAAFFSIDTTTGFFRPAPNTIGVSVNGTEKYRFDNTGFSIADAPTQPTHSVNKAYADSIGPQIGDIKMGFQTINHNGWFICSGQSTSFLSAQQRANATALGFPTSLPDARGATPRMLASGPLGALSGSNTRVITQANLPNITLSAQSAGQHTHQSFGALGGQDRTWEQFTGTWNLYLNMGQNGTAYPQYKDLVLAAGAHTHNVPLGGNGTPFDVTSMAFNINLFVYLGTA